MPLSSLPVPAGPRRFLRPRLAPRPHLVQIAHPGRRHHPLGSARGSRPADHHERLLLRSRSRRSAHLCALPPAVGPSAGLGGCSGIRSTMVSAASGVGPKVLLRTSSPPGSAPPRPLDASTTTSSTCTPGITTWGRSWSAEMEGLRCYQIGPSLSTRAPMLGSMSLRPTPFGTVNDALSVSRQFPLIVSQDLFRGIEAEA
jgi:hypothetical protein